MLASAWLLPAVLRPHHGIEQCGKGRRRISARLPVDYLCWLTVSMHPAFMVFDGLSSMKH